MPIGFMIYSKIDWRFKKYYFYNISKQKVPVEAQDLQFGGYLFFFKKQQSLII